MFSELTRDELEVLDWKMLSAYVDVHRHYKDTEMFNEFRLLVGEVGQALAWRLPGG